MPNHWKKPYTIQGARTQPRHWLEANWHNHTDPEVARIFANAGVPIKAASVQKYRQARGWAKVGKGPGAAAPACDVLPKDNPNQITVDQETTASTPEELLTELGLNPDEWEATEYSVTRYEALHSHESKDLEFNEGKLDGTVVRSVEKVPMWRIKARFVRKRAIAIQPEIHPVCAAPVRAPRHQFHTSYKTAMVLSDVHTGFEGRQPFHDRRALDLVIQVAREAEPDEVYILGDLVDLTMFSDYLNSPECQFTTQPTILETHFWLATLRSVCPNAKIGLLEGNHDKRISRRVQTHLLEARGLRRATDVSNWPVMSLPYLLDLPSLYIDYINNYPHAEVWLNNNIRLSHGENFSSTPGATARAVLKNANVNNVFGHSHSAEIARRTVHGRHKDTTLQAWSLGCLCHIDGRVPSKIAHPQWQQSFGLIHYSADPDKAPQFEEIAIENGGMFWRGLRFNAVDCTNELRQMFPQHEW